MFNPNTIKNLKHSNNMDFNNYKFRCSSLGHLMTEARSKSESLSESTKTHLIDCYIAATFNRRNKITSKFLDKGLQVEELSIDLLSSVNKEFYIKNEDRLSNDFIQGTPDIVIEDEEKKVIDIKSSWDIYTFGRSMKTENKLYYWQLQGYMWLTGAKKAILAYCLVDTPDEIIDREIKRALYQSGISENSQAFIDYKNEMTAYYKYSDIPQQKRVFTKDYDFNPDAITALQNRIIEAREFLNQINW